MKRYSSQSGNRKIHSEERMIEVKHIRPLVRQSPKLQKRKKLLIMCEGENTEPSYFNKFRCTTADVRVTGLGISSTELIQKTRRQPDLKQYDEVWCVYDRDDRINSFNYSLQLATQYGFNVAYSIQAFEYWILLHFQEHNGGALHRKECIGSINRHLKKFGCSFGESTGKIIDTKMFFLMQSVEINTGTTRQELAIKRSKRIYDSFDHKNPAMEESSTTVFKLVEELNKYR